MPSKEKYPVLTPSEFEIDQMKGIHRDSLVIGMGLAIWDYAQLSYCENELTNYHSCESMVQFDSGEAYRNELAAYIKSCITDGNSYWDVTTGEVYPIPKGSKIDVFIDESMNIHIKASYSNGFNESYINEEVMKLEGFYNLASSLAPRPANVESYTDMAGYNAQAAYNELPQFNVEFPLQHQVPIDMSYYANSYDRLKEVAEGEKDKFNWGIVTGLIGITLDSWIEYCENKVRISFKTARNPISWSRLRPTQQEWRILNVLGKGSKYVKYGRYAKVIGVVGTGISVFIAGSNILMGEGTAIDYLDLGIGMAAIGASLFLTSNPVGWFICAGASVYFAGRLVYDIYEEIND